MRNAIVMAVLLAGLAACASAPGSRAPVTQLAPRVSEFRFDDSPPLSAAADFGPWVALAEETAANAASFDACLADGAACQSRGLERYRRLLGLGATLAPLDQLELVHEYFNTVDKSPSERLVGIEEWASLYRVAATHAADCKGIALGKYFTLRRLGWDADDLRVIMNWDEGERDWHALLAVRAGDRTFVLDSILGLQPPRAYGRSYMVYSISENGLWDHAPEFVPVP